MNVVQKIARHCCKGSAIDKIIRVLSSIVSDRERVYRTGSCLIPLGLSDKRVSIGLLLA